MSVNPKNNKHEAPEVKASRVLAHGSDAAPIIYFDGAAAYGGINGVVQLELAANLCVPVATDGKSTVATRILITAHLRCSVVAAEQLADTIDKALGFKRGEVKKSEESGGDGPDVKS